MKSFVSFLLIFLFSPAWAARPFVTDDARFTSPGSCQLENWARTYRNGLELWALPACNPTGDLEITLGGGHSKSDFSPSTDDYVIQFKTIARPLKTNSWGWGIAAGSVTHPSNHPGPNSFGNSYAYIPLSVSFDNDKFVMHNNLGWLNDKATGQDNLTWGVGGELSIAHNIFAIAEVFGDNHAQPYYQLGARFAVIPNLFQIDTTIGQQFSGQPSGHWVSFGLRLTPEKLF